MLEEHIQRVNPETGKFPLYRAAAKALTNVRFPEPSSYTPGDITQVTLRTINASMIYMMTRGIPQTAQYLDAAIADRKVWIDIWQHIVSFFLENSTADVALPENFDEGSPCRMYLQEQSKSDPDDLEFTEPVTLSEATDSLAYFQLELAELVSAKAAIQQALESGK